MRNALAAARNQQVAARNNARNQVARVPGLVLTRAGHARVSRETMTVWYYKGGLRDFRLPGRTSSNIGRVCQDIAAYAENAAAKRNPSSFLLVAEGSDGRLMGLAACYMSRSLKLDVARGGLALVVDAICAERGVGQVLMREVEAVAKDTGVPAVVLKSVTGAVETYKRWGFVRGGGPIADEDQARARYQAMVRRDRAGKTREFAGVSGGLLFDMNDAFHPLVAMWKAPQGKTGTTPFAPVTHPVELPPGTGVLRRYARDGRAWKKVYRL